MRGLGAMLCVATVVACGGDNGAGPDAGPAVPTCTDTVAGLVTPASGTTPGAGDGSYVVPSAAERASLAASITAALTGDEAAVAPHAAAAGYRVCRIGETGAVVWTHMTPGAGHASLAVRPAPTVALVVEVPHATFEVGTRDEGVLLFDQLGARALIVATAHRCANAGAASGCDGSTGVCGSSAPYPESDMAHTEQSMFHVAHVTVAEYAADDLVINLHGMSADGIHLSNGTTDSIAADAPVARFAAALSTGFPGHVVLTCNDYPGASTTGSLCGTTNVQGRHVNGSVDACTTPAVTASERFIHMEQSRAVRDRPADVAAALSSML